MDEQEEENKIKYRTEKTRCDPDITEYFDDKKFQLGEHEFTPHYNKFDRNTQVDDYVYELMRFMIAYIQDANTDISGHSFSNYKKDDIVYVNKIKNTLANITNAVTQNNVNFYNYYLLLVKRYGLMELIKCFTSSFRPYDNQTLEQIQKDVRNGKYNVILEKEFPVNVNDKNQITRITNAVNDYNNVVALNGEINKQLIELSKKLEEKIDENTKQKETIEKLELIKQKQTEIFKKRKEQYKKAKNLASIFSWVVFCAIIGIIIWRIVFYLYYKDNSIINYILPILPLTLSLSVVFYILRRTVYRNEILEIEYEHKETHAEFYSSLLADDANKNDEEIKQFHRNVYIETLQHNPVENVMKKHKNDQEQTTKLLEKIIEILKIKS